MKITNISIKPISYNSKIKAYVSITLDNCFVINNLKIIEGKYNTFVKMPNKKDKSNNYTDIVYPINYETKEYIQNRVLNAYYNIENNLRKEGLNES